MFMVPPGLADTGTDPPTRLGIPQRIGAGTRAAACQRSSTAGTKDLPLGSLGREDPVPNPTSKRSLAAVILAAGKGKRLRSSTPKVLHPVCGRPALWWAVRNVLVAKPQRVVIVVHHGADAVRDAVASWGIRPEPVFVEQGEPLGTGHAVLQAESAVGRVA